jgi:hypothetical protein
MEMPARVFLIGTSHAYQFGEGVVFGDATCTLEIATQFRQYLTDVRNLHGIQAFAEEMSLDALAEMGQTASLPKLVADELSILHRYCDPTQQEKAQLGIRQDNSIRAEHRLDGWTQEQIEADVLARGSVPSDRIREQFWFQRIQELNVWPLLFICGANHFNSFGALLRAEHFDAMEAHRDWAPAANRGYCESERSGT